MSQYPPPPPGSPQPYYQPQYMPVSQALPTVSRSRACRTAAVVQMSLGAIGLAVALCLGVVFAMVAGGMIPMEDQPELTEITKELPVSISAIMLAASICMGVPALTLLVLGIFVWRESRIAIIVSMILAGLLLVLNLLGSVLQAVSQKIDASLCTNLVSSMLLAGLIGLLTWALRDLHARAVAMRNLYEQWQRYYASQQPAQQQQPDQQWPQPPGDTPLPPPPVPPAQ